MGCTHTQTDVSLTLNGGVLGIKPIGPKVSKEKLPDDSKVQVPKDFNLKDDRLLTKDNEIATEDSQSTMEEDSSLDPARCPDEGLIPPGCEVKPPKN